MFYYATEESSSTKKYIQHMATACWDLWLLHVPGVYKMLHQDCACCCEDLDLVAPILDLNLAPLVSHMTSQITWWSKWSTCSIRPWLAWIHLLLSSGDLIQSEGAVAIVAVWRLADGRWTFLQPSVILDLLGIGCMFVSAHDTCQPCT